jgi:hypothetical protein
VDHWAPPREHCAERAATGQLCSAELHHTPLSATTPPVVQLLLLLLLVACERLLNVHPGVRREGPPVLVANADRASDVPDKMRSATSAASIGLRLVSAGNEESSSRRF